MTTKKINIVIADDHVLFRKGLIALFSEFSFIGEVGEASNGKELLKYLKGAARLPDVVLLDINMPVMDGFEAAKKMRELYPALKIIVLTMEDNEHFILQMIEDGANGYLLKNCEPDELEKALKTIMSRDFYFNENITELIRKAYINAVKHEHSFNIVEEFTRREKEVLGLICREYTTSEIAEKLYLSPRTIESHRNKMIEKAGVKNLAGLIVYAIKNKIVNI